MSTQSSHSSPADLAVSVRVVLAAGPPVIPPASRPDLSPGPPQAELGSGRRKHPSRLRRTSTPDNNEPGHVQRLLQIYDSIRDGACRSRLFSYVNLGHAGVPYELTSSLEGSWTCGDLDARPQVCIDMRNNCKRSSSELIKADDRDVQNLWHTTCACDVCSYLSEAS